MKYQYALGFAGKLQPQHRQPLQQNTTPFQLLSTTTGHIDNAIIRYMKIKNETPKSICN